MIVKNEEQVIWPCSESLKDIVDKIIMVDIGVIDNTKDCI